MTKQRKYRNIEKHQTSINPLGEHSFLTNPRFLTICAILSVVLGILAIYLGLTASTKKQIRSLSRKMGIYRETNVDKLSNKYPLGFVLFAIHEKTKKIWPDNWPEGKNPLRGYEINWDTAAVVYVGARYILLNFPTIKSPSQIVKNKLPNPLVRHMKIRQVYKGQERFMIVEASVPDPEDQGLPAGIWLHVYSAFSYIGRQIGVENVLSILGENYQICVEVLIDDQDGLICVLGLQENEFTRYPE